MGIENVQLKAWEWKFLNWKFGFWKILENFVKDFFLGWLSWLSFCWVKEYGGRNLPPPLPPRSLFLSFCLLASYFFTSHPPLSLFISFFPLIFLLHFIISSHKRHVSKLLNSPSSISINISLDLYVLSIFIPHPFLVKPIFFALKWLLPPRDIPF